MRKLALLAAALLAVAGIQASTADAAYIECAVFGPCYGTDNDDEIVGTDGYDEIRAQEGSDLVRGGGSGDDIFGGRGPDVLKGGGGDDALHGGPNDDELRLASDNSGGDFGDCGDGDDTVWADLGDFIDFDCETVVYP